MAIKIKIGETYDKSTSENRITADNTSNAEIEFGSQFDESYRNINFYHSSSDVYNDIIILEKLAEIKNSPELLSSINILKKTGNIPESDNINFKKIYEISEKIGLTAISSLIKHAIEKFL